MREAYSDIKFIRCIISGTSPKLDKPTTQYFDKTVTAIWAETSESMRHAKLIKLKYDFFKECYTAGTIDPRDLSSEENPADVLS